MNVFTFSGNIGKDCTVRDIGSTTLCQFSVAVKAGFGDRESTVWITAKLWGKRASGKLPDYLVKGQMVECSGELSEDKWTTQDGTDKVSLCVNVDKVGLIGGKKEPNQQQQKPNQSDEYQVDDSSVPF